MMKKILLFFALAFGVSGFAQNKTTVPKGKTKNVIVLSLDGYRWQELFDGADSALIHNSRYTSDSAWTFDKYWAETPRERREKLMPFTWNYIAKRGQIYGNRNLGNKVDVKNTYWFSYPGRSETWIGYFDSALNSNAKVNNPNINVMEFINQQSGYEGKVAAFASWDVVAWILNRERNGLLVNIWGEDVKGTNLTELQKEANAFQHMAPDPWGKGERIDASTYLMSKAYLKAQHPRLLYIDFGDPDVFAHAGMYTQYLDAAHKTDLMIKDLWEYLQSDPFYKDQTTLMVLTDHGRGVGPQWTDHGSGAAGSGETYLMVLGPDSKPLGEVSKPMQIYQDQFAQTIAHLLGFHFAPDHPVGKPVESVLK